MSDQTRRSKRLKASAGNEAPTAHRKASLARQRGKRVMKAVTLSPHVLTEMPLDILYEVCSYLKPIDLLHLARTAHAFRDVLMSRSSKPFWVCAFSQIEGFPPCPEDLAETQYTNLMFSFHCHECLKDGNESDSILILLGRIRLCQACLPEKYKPWNRLTPKPPSELKVVIPTTSLYIPGVRTNWHADTLKYDVGKADSLREVYLGLGYSKERKAAWLKERKAEHEKCLTHAGLWVAYVNHQRLDAHMRDQMIKTVRVARIRQLLVDLGWNKELDLLDSTSVMFFSPEPRRWYHHALVDKSVGLSEEEWLTMKPELLKWFERIRQAQLVEEHVALVKARVKKWVEPIYTTFILSQPSKLAYPNLVEICLLEEFRAPLEDTPPEVDLTEEAFEAGKARLSTYMNEWREDRDEELLKIMRKSSVYSSQEIELKRDSLRFASTIFRCGSCSSTATYPEVFVHKCMLVSPVELELPRQRVSSTTPVYVDSTFNIAPLYQQYAKMGHEAIKDKEGAIVRFALCRNRVWAPLSKLTVHEASHIHLKGVLELCGLPPDTTKSELEKADPYVATRCNCFSPNMLMRWSSAVRMEQMRSGHRRPINHSRLFSLPSEKLMAKVVQMRANRKSEYDTHRWWSYGCLLCGDSDIQNASQHLKFSHNLLDSDAEQFLSLTLADQLPSHDFGEIERSSGGSSKTISASELKALNIR